MHLSNANVSFIRELHGGAVLLDLCFALPTLSDFRSLRGICDGKPSITMIDGISLESMLKFRIKRLKWSSHVEG